MKQMLKTMTALLLAVVILCTAAVSAGATPAPLREGDVDGDGYFSILDATQIQRFLAGICPLGSSEEFEALARWLADTDGDGAVTILDATRIQRILAGIDDFAEREDRFYIGAYFESEFFSFYPDYSSGKAMAGIPVTFHASNPGESADRLTEKLTGDAQADEYLTERIREYRIMDRDTTYAFYIDDELVQDFSHENELVYTFDEPGEYTVTAVSKNLLGFTGEYCIEDYSVVAPPEEPVPDLPELVYVGFSDATQQSLDCGALYARAIHGAGDYEYRFSMLVSSSGLFFGKNLDDILGLAEAQYPGQFTVEYLDSAHTAARVIQDYSPKASFAFTDLMSREYASGYERQYMGEITVTARDSEGQESEPVTVTQNAGYLVG